MFNLIVQFSYLQLLDVLTTLAFLANGAEEGNPFVSFLLNAAPSPLAGLIAVKGMAMALALYCWRSGRGRLLSRANVFYAALVAWNLVAFLLSTGA